MPKFKVEMIRIGYAFTTVEIEADDILEAREKASENAGNYDYTEKDATHETGTATRIE